MRSTLLPGQPWEVMVDLFFYREPEETKEPGEEDAADFGGEAQPYGQLPAPGGKLASAASAAQGCWRLKIAWLYVTLLDNMVLAG